MERTTAVVALKSLSYCVFMSLGVTGNVLVCVAIWKNKKLRTLPNYLVFNLAIADLLFAVTVMPFLLVTAIAKEWVLGNPLCKISGFLTTFFCCVSILTLVSISINRYFAVGRPKQYSSIFTAKRTFICIGVVWFTAAVVSAPPLIGWSRFRSGDNFCTIDGRKDISYSVFIIFVAYIIPLVMLIGLYSRIFCILRNHGRVMSRLRKHGAPGRDYDDYSSTEVGSLRRRYQSNATDNIVMKGTVKPALAQDDKVLDTPPEERYPSYNEESNGYRRSVSADDLDRIAVAAEDSRYRSSSVNVTSNVAGNKGEEVDVRGLIVFRNKLYVNNVSVYDRNSSVSQSQSNLAASRDSGLNQEQEIRRTDPGRLSNKLFSLTKTLRNRTKPNLRKMSKEAKITRMLFAVVSVFFICWTPLVVGSVVYAFDINKTEFGALSFGIIIACLNSVCNPIIYAFMNTQFRRAFIEIMNQVKRCTRCKNSNVN